MYIWCTLIIYPQLYFFIPFPFSLNILSFPTNDPPTFMLFYVCDKFHLIGVFCRSMNGEIIYLSKGNWSLAIRLRNVTSPTSSSSNNYYLPISPQSGWGLQSPSLIHDEMLTGFSCVHSLLVGGSFVVISVVLNSTVTQNKKLAFVCCFRRERLTLSAQWCASSDLVRWKGEAMEEMGPSQQEMGARGMTQWVDSLSCKHEDLGLHSNTHIKSQS